MTIYNSSSHALGSSLAKYPVSARDLTDLESVALLEFVVLFVPAIFFFPDKSMVITKD